MKIDKTLFLMLTGGLAGCVIHATTGPDAPVGPPPPPPPPPPPQVAPAAAAPRGTKLVFSAKHRAAVRRPVAGDPTTAAAPPTAPVPGAPPEATPPAPMPPVPVAPPAPTAEGGACVSPATPPPAPATCKTFATDANCAKAQQMCTAIGTYFKPAAAHAGVTTMSASPADCSTAAAEGHRAANSANLCPDAGITQTCAALAVQCRTTPDACAHELAQLNDAGLQRVAACAAANSCGTGLHGCVLQLFPTFEWGPN